MVHSEVIFSPEKSCKRRRFLSISRISLFAPDVPGNRFRQFLQIQGALAYPEVIGSKCPSLSRRLDRKVEISKQGSFLPADPQNGRLVHAKRAQHEPSGVYSTSW